VSNTYHMSMASGCCWIVYNPINTESNERISQVHHGRGHWNAVDGSFTIGHDH
jgi:hypothetical protein